MNHAEYCKQFLPPGGIVLDVGSGRGKFLREMAKLGFRGFGVEINPGYIEEAQKLAVAEGVSVNIMRGNAENLPFPDNYFDFVNCGEVTEHVNDPERVCNEIFRVLKPGGKCYISFHNRFGIYDYHYRAHFINWIPRSWTEPILKLFKKQKQDSVIGRQKLTTMHYYIYGSALNMLCELGFAASDIRIEKIKKRFGLLALLFYAPYILLLRPFYFNTFHLLLSKK